MLVFIILTGSHGYVPRSATWGNGRDFVQSFGRTEAEAHLIAGYEQLCDTKMRIEAVQTWTPETGGQRGEGD